MSRWKVRTTSCSPGQGKAPSLRIRTDLIGRRDLFVVLDGINLVPVLHAGFIEIEGRHHEAAALHGGREHGKDGGQGPVERVAVVEKEKGAREDGGQDEESHGDGALEIPAKR